MSSALPYFHDAVSAWFGRTFPAPTPAQAQAWLDAEQIPPDRRRFERSADLRYHGQSFELPVPVPAGPLSADDVARLREQFHAMHERAYGYAASEDPVELVNVRLAAIGVTPPGTPQQKGGWTLPADAADTKSPLTVDDKVLAIGKKIFTDKCQKCHGSSGRGNGPDADPDHPPGNLTDPKRAPRNPDGVMFYKIWNGRSDPKMPAFKTDMPRQDVWTVIHYVKTLRQTP